MAVYTTTQSPLGELLLVGDRTERGVRLTSVTFAGRVSVEPGWTRDDAAFADVVRQLDTYFAGERTGFEVETATHGTPFQERVWAAVREIPYGTTTSYGKVAEQVGAPRDRIRAVGAAIGANPLLIVTPCHRVTGADGSLTGYAGGLHRKEALLVLEGALHPLFT